MSNLDYVIGSMLWCRVKVDARFGDVVCDGVRVGLIARLVYRLLYTASTSTNSIHNYK